MSGGTSQAYAASVDDNEASTQIAVVYLGQEPAQRSLGFFNRGWPDPQSDHAGVRSSRIHPSVCEILVEGDDNRPISLRTGEYLFIGCTAHPEFADMAYEPPRSLAD